MEWDRFTEACPEIATMARERFEQDELVLLGTLRRDGSPRISPNEVDFTLGKLFMGMMPGSMKALDLLRDPRLVVHSVPESRMGTHGDIKLYGRAVDERDPEVREAYARAIEARSRWRPEGAYPLYSLDVRSAGYAVFGEGQHALAWDPKRGLRRLALG